MHKVVLITGVSSGFGKHTSGLLARQGYKVYGTIRRQADMENGVQSILMDLTHMNSITECVNHIIRQEGRIDVLINNAGMHTGGALEVIPQDILRLQLETNVMGVVNLVRAVLPHMRRQCGGTIINISSIGGLMGLPFQGYYSMSKFSIEAFSEVLRMETRPFGIKVITLNPGDFRTHNTQNRLNFAAYQDIGAYEQQFSKTLAVIEEDETTGQDPIKLAKKISKILSAKNPDNRYIIASPKQRLAVILHRLLPLKWWASILRRHYRIP